MIDYFAVITYNVDTEIFERSVVQVERFLVMHDIDMADFIQTLDKCKGDVLNLKSKLCQMIGVANIMKGAVIKEAALRCTNPEDESLLFRFNLYKEVPGQQSEDEEDE